MSAAVDQATSGDAEQDDADKKEAAESDEDILKEARDRYTACTTAENDNRASALDDLRFLSGGVNQWDPEAVRIRTLEKRPMITVNNLPVFLHQITNDQRQNKRAVKVHPVDDNADEETADVEQGLIRHIEYDSNADVAYSTAVNSAAAIGFGWFRLVTEYESETSFDQKIMFKRIRNALSVHIDPLSQEPDGSDMKFAFIDSLEAREEFKRQYPKANATNTDLIGQQMYQGWFTEQTVLVCEYYRIKETPDILCELVDGSKGYKSELPKERHGEIAMLPDGKPKERRTTRLTVEWFKLTGADVLERTVIKCKWIPVFPVYGDEVDIEGKVVRSGMIRHSKDSFKMYNYWMTCATEEVTLRPKTPFIGFVGQFETAKDQWAAANSRSYAFIEADPITVEGTLAPLPQRQAMADIPSGMLAMAMHAADNKKATTGLFDSSLGARGNATSGKQEIAQQRQGDVANFHYTDNLNTTVRHVGRCLLSMIPNYYDGARTIRILGEDDTADQVKINQQIEKKNSKTGAIETVMHDLTVGTYDVTVKAGPAYDTRRQEAAEFLTSAIQGAKDPAAANILTYLSLKYQDIPGSEEAAEMLEKTLPPGVVPQKDDGQEPTVQTPHGPIPLSQVGPFIQQMGTALQNADKALDSAKLKADEAKALEEQNRAAELEIKRKEADTRQYDAETKRMVADADLIRASAEAAAAGENVVTVAQAAAREAVSIVLSTPADQLHPAVLAMGQQPPAQPEQQPQALEQPPEETLPQVPA